MTQPAGRFKIVLLGESSVGKTCMLRSLVGQEFSTHIMSTIGIDFERKTFEVNGRPIELEIWDTAGQEKFRTLTSFHYRNARGIIMVYDITKRKSFEHLKSYWLKSINEKADDLIPIFIVGNKLDLGDQRQVPYEEGKDVHDRIGSYNFFETSSKTGENVQELFLEVATVMASMWKPLLTPSGQTEQTQPDARRHSIRLQHSDAAAASKRSCCSN